MCIGKYRHIIIEESCRTFADVKKRGFITKQRLEKSSITAKLTGLTLRCVSKYFLLVILKVRLHLASNTGLIKKGCKRKKDSLSLPAESDKHPLGGETKKIEV